MDEGVGVDGLGLRLLTRQTKGGLADILDRSLASTGAGFGDLLTAARIRGHIIARDRTRTRQLRQPAEIFGSRKSWHDGACLRSIRNAGYRAPAAVIRRCGYGRPAACADRHSQMPPRQNVGGIRQLRRSPTYSSHSLPSNAWWRTRLGGKLRQGPPAAEGGGRRPALTGLATQPYSVHRERRLDAPADASAVQTRTDGCSKRDPNLDYFEAEWQFLGIIPEAVVTGLMQTPESLPVTAFLSLSKLHGARAG